MKNILLFVLAILGIEQRSEDELVMRKIIKIAKRTYGADVPLDKPVALWGEMDKDIKFRCALKYEFDINKWIPLHTTTTIHSLTKIIMKLKNTP